MNDLISRQEAIDALMAWEEDSFWDDECLKHRGEPYWVAPSDVIERIPSAQPEPTTEIYEILNYLDTTLYPIVSPDNWYVYAELHDMVSMLPSAQPEQRWILVTERLPNKDGLYLVTTNKGQVQTHVFSHNGNSKEYWMRCNKVWMPLPEPYEEEK